MPSSIRAAFSVALVSLGCGAQSNHDTGAAPPLAIAGQGQAGAAAQAGAGQGGAPAQPSRCADATTPLELTTVGNEGDPSIALDGSNLLVLDPALGEARLIDLVTRTARPLVTGRSSIHSAALLGDYAYWVDWDQTSGNDSLLRVSLSRADALETIAMRVGGVPPLPYQDAVYFRYDGLPDDTSGGRIEKWTPDAGAPEVLVSNSGAILQIVTDGAFLYWAACFAGIQRAPLSGGPPEHLADAYCPTTVAVDGTDLYFADLYTEVVDVGQRDIGRLGHVNLADRSVTSFADDVHPDMMSNLVLDASSLYVGLNDGLYRINRTTEEPVVLAHNRVTSIAVDDSCIYWADADAHRVYVLQR